MSTIIGTRRMVLYVDGDDYSTNISKCVVAAGESDSDFMSFPDALAGGLRDYTLQLTFRQDTADDSLWYFAWDRAGDDVDVVLWPNGYNGGVEGATYPKVTGTVTVVEPDGDFVGGEANRSNTAVNVCEVEWKFTAKPVIDITPA
jgi:hypothetical protein